MFIGSLVPCELIAIYAADLVGRFVNMASWTLAYTGVHRRQALSCSPPRRRRTLLRR